jgi:1-acyl-sn-glycerol-3-phosphate acyltransferase
MLIIANHVTTFDGPLVQYALPGALRRRIAMAMSGEMLRTTGIFAIRSLSSRAGASSCPGRFTICC